MLKLHSLIDNNFSHPEYGRLLRHRDTSYPNVLHYSVQLNDSLSLGWEALHSGRYKDTGKVGIWRIKWNRFRPAKRVKYLEREQIKKALHISIAKFHKRWKYELFRFNCEHWARLVTTGDCRCFQIKEFKELQKIPVVLVMLVGVPGVVKSPSEHNRSAQKLMEKKLKSS